MRITDMFGNKIANGTWLLNITADHAGDVMQAAIHNERLVLRNYAKEYFEISPDLMTDDGCLAGFTVIRSPYKKDSFPGWVKRHWSVELQNAGNDYQVDCNDLNDVQFAYLRGICGIDADREDIISCDVLTLADAEIPPYSLPIMGWNADTADQVLSTFVKDAEHYLVYASGCRWDGGDGYLFATSRQNAFSRNDDSTITPICVTPHGKALVCLESSHDVPTGSRTIVIALSKKEYESLRNAPFEKVAKFAKRLSDRAV